MMLLNKCIGFLFLWDVCLYVIMLSCKWCVILLQSECYHYLFDAAIKLHQLGLDWSTPNHGPIHSPRSLRIAGDSNLSVKARKVNGEIDPFPVR